MNDSKTPARRHLVLAGGGHSHVAVLKHFGMRPAPGLALTLVSRTTYAPYSGMLPGLIAGHYDFDACHIDLRRLAHFAGADFVQADVESVEPENQRLYVSDRPPLHYDFLSLNIGAQPAVPRVHEKAARVFPVKPVEALLEGCRELRRALQAGNGRLAISVVGGGAGGVELILALHHGLAREGLGERWDWRLVTDQAEILTEHNRRVRARFERVLLQRHIEVITRARVTAVEPPGLRCVSGRVIAADFVMWATAVAAPKWLDATGLDLDERGFIRIDARLRSTSHPNVFAAGDLAGSMETPHPKSGVYAVKQGAVLAVNLRRYHENRRLERYRPQTRALALISTGDRYAVASRGGLYAVGGWLWRVKDWIDRRWMAKYNDLPVMREPERAASKGYGEADVDSTRELTMRCGGCGAKVSDAVLKRVLKRLSKRTPEGVDIGLEDMDDAAVFTPPGGDAKLVQSIDYFRDFINDPFLLGEIAANHALSDLYAMGARPHSALALATLPYAAESVMEEQLYQLMAGAMRTLDTAGAVLLGGHSGEGAELAIGFSVNGVIDADDLARRRTLAPGQVLILTKPLGTGALFAADMRHRAQGRWIDQAVTMMRQSSAQAADCLRAHHVSACTDVTGFGLIGHLLALARPSGLGADIELDALPLLEGARECVAAGIFSSLQPQNARLEQRITATDAVRTHPAWPLLFDPQTSGGLLAAVPPDEAKPCIAELRELGYRQASIIGRARPVATTALNVI